MLISGGAGFRPSAQTCRPPLIYGPFQAPGCSEDSRGFPKSLPWQIFLDLQIMLAAGQQAQVRRKIPAIYGGTGVSPVQAARTPDTPRTNPEPSCALARCERHQSL